MRRSADELSDACASDSLVSNWTTMAKKAFLLRVDDKLLAAMQAWAEADMRSLNGQIEFLLKQALAKRGVKVEPDLKTKPHADPSES
jgi:hypothetical protein